MTADSYQLSPAQRQWWNARSGVDLAPLRGRYPLPAGTTQADVQQALDLLSDRHEALRLRITADARHEPFQQVPEEHRPQVSRSAPDAGWDWCQQPVAAVYEEGALTLYADPVALDPESLRVVGTELAVQLAGGNLPDDEDRLQFIDVSEWELEQDLPNGAGPVAQLTVPALPPATATGASAAAALDRELVTRLAEHATDAKSTVEDLVLHAWVTVLARYVGPDPARIVVARYRDGRDLAGTRTVVGPLGRYEAVAVALPVGESLDTEALPGLADPAVCAASFATVAAPSDADSTVDAPAPLAALHLDCVVTDGGVELRVWARAGGDYPGWLHDAVTLVLRTMGGDHSDEQLVGPAELAAIARLGAGPANRADAAATLQQLVNDGIRRADPGRPAVVDGDDVLSYAELDASAEELSGTLIRAGVRPGDRVAVLVDRTWRTVVAFAGVLRAGGTYVPLDPEQPTARLHDLLRLAGSTTVVGGAVALPDGFAAVPVPRVTVAATVEPAPRVGPTDPAYVIFTSGSTGTPRPVLVEQGAVARLWYALADAVYGGSERSLRVSVNAPATFDASIKQLIQLAGGHTLCPISEDVRHDPAGLLTHLARHEVDVLDATPSHLRLLLDARRPGDTLPGLLLIGGEAIDDPLWQELAALDGVRSVNLYGPTECTVDTTTATVTSDEGPTIGRPLPGVAVVVADPSGRPLPIGAPGELLVTGGQLAVGYLHDEPATARHFVTLTGPTGEQVRAYRTGDLVRLRPDGRLDYLGRIDDQIKVRGLRIEPAEISHALRQHPGVRATAVTTHGEGAQRRLVAYAVPGSRAVDPDQLVGINPHETRYLYDEIFTQETYLRGGVTLPAGAVVLDVGANIGVFSLFVRTLVPDARLYAFEPVAPVFAALRQNLEPAGGEVHLFDHGLSDREGETTFTYYPGYSMMSGQRDYADPDAEKQVVRQYLSNERDSAPTGGADLLDNLDDLLDDRFAATEQRCRLRPLSQVIDEQGIDRIDLLKIDVQRAELDVLLGIEDRHWALVQQVAMEVHDAPDGPTRGRGDQITKLLESHGFQVLLEQDTLLTGTDRYNLCAFRSQYRATVTPAPAVRGDAVTGPALRDWLADRLPAHLVPDSVELIDHIPLTRNGKLDRAALPAPDTGAAGPYAAPANRAEEILVEVWQEILGIPRIGVEDNVFQIGADSIRGIRVRAAAAKRGVSFPLRDVFRHQTIRELVRHGELTFSDESVVDSASVSLIDEEDRARLPHGVRDAYPMTALQLGMLYHSRLTAERHTYHVVTGHRVAAALDLPALRRAVDGLVAAHPALRTTFDLAGFREPLQLVYATAVVPLAHEDLRGLPPEDREARTVAAFTQERGDDVDPCAGPPLRIRALDLDEQAFELIVSHHHAALDGWSLHLLLEELLERYDEARGAAGRTAGPSPMPPRRLVELERRSREDQESRRYWRTVLAGFTPAPRVTDDMPCLTGRHTVLLGADLTARLRDAAARHALPLKSVLLAAHARVVGETSHVDDVVTGLVCSVRPGEDGADRTLGLFLNTLPVRIPLAAASPLDNARRAWQVERDLIGHHLLPLADIESDLGVGRLFDVFFNFTDFSSLRSTDQRRSRVVAEREATVDVAFRLAVDIDVLPDEPGLRLTLQYDERALSDEAVRAWARRYAEVLELFVDRPGTALPAVPAATGSTPSARAADEVPAGASGPVSAVVTRLWTELLGRPPRDGESFFDAGGDSLLALRFVTALRDRHQVPVTLAEFRRDPRPDHVSALIGADREDTAR
ncbi:amino acid adenylation domain-containing protein [Micromonospora sp. NPDC005413]|uniref:amino acid adenylation domain-containing protein n=1 Tax=Micromonospora sp. NPDC005413 TaxID=3154563 RepID=UPI0033B596C6